MRFAISASLDYQVFGPSTFLFSLQCDNSPGQSIISESISTGPSVTLTDMQMGPSNNRFTKLKVNDPCTFNMSYQATVETAPELVEIAGVTEQGIETLGEAELAYLFPSRYCPSDLMRGAAAELFGDIQGSLAKALAIEDWLYEHLTYSVGSSNEQSWAPDTFLSREGVCRDFSHLGIALCRAQNIPARYVTVYAHQLQPQDFHAAFEVFVDGRWFLIDGTRLAPLNGMVRIASGRDASDTAVSSLYGNVQGGNVDVQVNEILGDDGNSEFNPLTRSSLQEQGKAICLP